MPLALAERSGLIAPSATLAMGAEAKRLKAKRRLRSSTSRSVNLTLTRRRTFRRRPSRRSGPVRRTTRRQRGFPSFAKLWPSLYTRQHGLATDSAQVIISNGAKQSIHNALMAVCGPGDEVIIPAPFWVSYADLVKLTGATPVIVDHDRVGIVQAHAGPVPGCRHAPHQAAHDQQSRPIPRASSTTDPNWRPWPTPCSRPTSVSSPTRSTNN